MESRSNQALTMTAAVVAAAILSSQSHVIGMAGAVAGDLTVLLALFAFDSSDYRSSMQSLALGAAAAFCLLTPFQVLANALSPLPAPANPQALADRPYLVVAIAWLAGTLLLFALDRFRMSARESMSLSGSGLTNFPSPASPSPAFTPAPAPVFRPAPIQVPPFQAQPPLQTQSPLPPPVEKPGDEEITVDVRPASTAASQPPMAAETDVTSIPPGRETIIYLNLVGEGLNVLRTVRAENLGRDYFRIADVMPEGEQWEFTPGQVVRCRKKSLSNGKHMVAYEEAPRAS